MYDDEARRTSPVGCNCLVPKGVHKRIKRHVRYTNGYQANGESTSIGNVTPELTPELIPELKSLLIVEDKAWIYKIV